MAEAYGPVGKVVSTVQEMILSSETVKVEEPKPKPVPPIPAPNPVPPAPVPPKPPVVAPVTPPVVTVQIGAGGRYVAVRKRVTDNGVTTMSTYQVK